MNAKINTAMKCVGSAMCIGGSVMLGSTLLNSSSKDFKKKAKKTAGKAIDALDTALTGIQSMMK